MYSLLEVIYVRLFLVEVSKSFLMSNKLRFTQEGVGYQLLD